MFKKSQPLFTLVRWIFIGAILGFGLDSLVMPKPKHHGDEMPAIHLTQPQRPNYPTLSPERAREIRHQYGITDEKFKEMQRENEEKIALKKREERIKFMKQMAYDYSITLFGVVWGGWHGWRRIGKQKRANNPLGGP